MATLSIANNLPSIRDCPSTLVDSKAFEDSLFSLLAESVTPQATMNAKQNLKPLKPADRGFWNALMADVLHRFGVNADAWQTSSELLCRCVINAENFDKALKLVECFPSPNGRLQVDRCAGETFLVAESSFSCTLQILQLASLLKLFSWLIDEPIPVLRVRLTEGEKPPFARLIETLFNCEIQPGSYRTAIVVDSAILIRPLVRVYRDLRSILALPSLALIPWSPPIAIKSRVTQLIAKAISRHGRAPALDEIAFQLQRSSSSLRRQLHQEGTSFQLLKDTWRQKQAEHLLKNPINSLDYIASRLGFECTSVFSRAFKSWTGMAPSRFRETLRSFAG